MRQPLRKQSPSLNDIRSKEKESHSTRKLGQRSDNSTKFGPNDVTGGCSGDRNACKWQRHAGRDTSLPSYKLTDFRALNWTCD